MRPIDADALKEMMDKILMPGKDVVMETYIDEVVCAVIDDSPTINYTPVRHGEWVDGMACQYCGQVDLSKPNYCPNCGAKMDSKK